MKKLPYLRLSTDITKLSSTAAYLYYILVYADFKKKTFSRAYLAKALGVTNLDYISNLLQEIEEAGLIKRTFEYNNDYHSGHISKKLTVSVNSPLKWFSVNINYLSFEGSASDKGFALKLRSLAFDDTLKIQYNKKDLAEKLGVSAPTLRKKLKQLKEMGIYDGDTFNQEYFPVIEICHLSEDRRDLVKKILVSDKNSRLYKQIQWFVDKKCHLKRDADRQLDNIVAGFLGGNKAVKSDVEYLL